MRMTKPTPTQEVLQTKARRYTPKSGTGPDIWLVGVAHVGQAAYYKTIQGLLDDQTTVLFEGVTKKGTSFKESLDPKKNAASASSYKMLSDALQLQFQLNGIDYSKPSFRNSDLTWEQMQAIEAKAPKNASGVNLATIGGMLDANSPQGKQLASMLSMMKDDPSSIEAMHLVMIEALSNPDMMSQAMP